MFFSFPLLTICWIFIFSSVVSHSKKIKDVDNRKLHPKVLKFNKESVNRPTKCQGQYKIP